MHASAALRQDADQGGDFPDAADEVSTGWQSSQPGGDDTEPAGPVPGELDETRFDKVDRFAVLPAVPAQWWIGSLGGVTASAQEMGD